MLTDLHLFEHFYAIILPVCAPLTALYIIITFDCATLHSAQLHTFVCSYVIKAQSAGNYLAIISTNEAVKLGPCAGDSGK